MKNYYEIRKTLSEELLCSNVSKSFLITTCVEYQHEEDKFIKKQSNNFTKICAQCCTHAKKKEFMKKHKTVKVSTPKVKAWNDGFRPFLISWLTLKYAIQAF